MHISQMVPAPEGLRAVYVAAFRDEGSPDGYTHTITDRPVDCLALLELEASDIRSGGTPERRGAARGRKTKAVGLVLEASTEILPAGQATDWFRRLYGDSFIGAKFIGYTRGESIDEIMEAVSQGVETPEINETRRYWSQKAREAVNRIVHG